MYYVICTNSMQKDEVKNKTHNYYYAVGGVVLVHECKYCSEKVNRQKSYIS